MNEPSGLAGPEQRAVVIMARWAAEAGYRRLRWSIPNDASWPGEAIAALPVRHDGLPGQYDLLGRRRWRGECVVCSLLRSDDGYQVLGVPGEEWLRPSADAAFAAAFEPGAAPIRSRLRLRFVAVALGLAIPATTLGGLALTATEGGDAPGAAPSRAQPTPVPDRAHPSESAPVPAAAADWVSQARVRLAAVTKQLDTLAAAEAAWSALPPDRRAAAGVPGPVAELQAVWADLLAQRAKLEEALTLVEELTEARSELAAAQHAAAEMSSVAGLAETPAARELAAEAARLQRRATEARARVAERYAQVAAVSAEPLPEPPPVEPLVEAVHETVTHLAATPPPGRPAEEPDGDAPAVAAGREIEPDAVTERPAEDAPDPDEPDLPELDADPEGVVRVDVSADGVEVETPRAEVSLGSGGIAVGVSEPARHPEKATEPVQREVEDVAPESGLGPQGGLPTPDAQPEAASAPAAPGAPAAAAQRAVDVGAECAERPGATAAECLTEAFEADPDAAESLREQVRELFGGIERTPSQQSSIPGGWPTP